MIDTSKTIYENFRATAIMRGPKDAAYYEGKTLSYLDLLELSNKFAAYYFSLGLTADDIITIVAPNTPESVAAFLGASQAGIKVHLLHPLTSQENILREFEEKKSKLLVTVSLFVRFYDKLLQKNIPMLILDFTNSLPLFKKIAFYLINHKKLALYHAHKELPRFRNACKKRADKETHYDSKAGRILLSSGGTTGKSKTIVLSDYAFLSVINTGLWIVGTKEEEMYDKTMLAALPMFHGFGLTMGVLTLLLYGGRIALLPSFRTNKVIKLLKKKHLNILIGVPALYEALLKNKHFKGKLLAPIRECFVGGDFISPALIERFNNRLSEGGSVGKMLEGYGLTEVVTVLSVNRLSDNKKGSIGKPLPGVIVKILNEEGKEVEPGEMGEIAISGKTLMNGYFDQKDPFYYFENKPWVKTGDIGYMDRDGFLFFVSRKKRMIKKKGLNIYPLAIEKFVSSLPYVEECAYLGEQKDGRDYTALFVHLKEGIPFESKKDNILDELKEEFNSYELPDFIFAKNEFEHTNVGKIDYISLSKEFQNHLNNKY